MPAFSFGADLIGRPRHPVLGRSHQATSIVFRRHQRTSTSGGLAIVISPDGAATSPGRRLAGRGPGQRVLAGFPNPALATEVAGERGEVRDAEADGLVVGL